MLLTACFMGLGMHLGAWRYRDEDPLDYTRPDFFRSLARTAERGKLHAVFLADTLTNAEEGTDRPALGALDPAVVLATMAGVTDRIGLVGTSSTTFNQPYDLARRYATLDHLSNGRAAWNAVTTFVPTVADNFGSASLPDRSERYSRAAEFCEVVLELWDSWAADAVVGDRDAGLFADPERVTPIDHVGPHFNVRGPMTMPRSPQGRPALFQAGGSDAGRDLAARYADVVFTVQNVQSEAVAFRADLRARAAAHGRAAGAVKVLPGLLPVLGSTMEEARARKVALDEGLGTQPELAKLARRVGVPAEELELDAPLPVDKLIPEDEFKGSAGFRAAVVALAQERGLTVRQILAENGGGHLQVVGTPASVADLMVRWYDAGAGDGFNLMVDVLPSGLDQIVDQLVPELQRRGVFHQDYKHELFLDNLGVGVA
ncbi:LLM class flavin-dependent oxidoreductase [Nocardioides hungaricus]